MFRFLRFTLTPIPDMAVTGGTLAANRATGAAARNINTRVTKVLINRYPHFPALLASIKA